MAPVGQGAARPPLAPKVPAFLGTEREEDEDDEAGGVDGGGCSGFQYGFTFDETVNEGDERVVTDGVTLLIDPMSVQYLMGAEIDYKEDLQGAQFIIRNPNANTTCGCGSSFSI